ncbi:MAG: hypothetical protein R2718_12285 [Solirubrobacterales bacterium]
MNGPVPKSVPWIVLGLVVVLIVVWATSEGDESTGSPAVQSSWAERADAYCSDGLQEAAALPLPGTAREVAADADARIGIVATVRDGIYTLGDPDAGDEALAAVYVRQLDADLGTLDAIATAARQGVTTPPRRPGSTSRPAGRPRSSASATAPRSRRRSPGPRDRPRRVEQGRALRVAR